ncbi:hypothetical protein CDL12_00509 [Handroanthus impetiginosus]|uniref:Uncharacterized protein n=1 Tax=Handroanthus impetiginosus TaxID=429701 RepID=A0A2G9IAF6_9LAMI|nr:hypothetical protein CDL12_00509 [Handroanthus impetiginosus]
MFFKLEIPTTPRRVIQHGSTSFGCLQSCKDGYLSNALQIIFSRRKESVDVGSSGKQNLIVLNLLRNGNVTAFSSTNVGN